MSLSEIGVFARCFPRNSVDDLAEAVRSAGFTLLQFNFAAIGLPTLNPAAQPGDLETVARAFGRRGISLWGLSATYNAIHPDPAIRAACTRQAARLIALSHHLGVKAVTLCTGTRNPHDMWAGHPDNASAAAWHDLRSALDVLLPEAAAAGVRLGIEPEPGNVIADVHFAHRLLNDLGGDAENVGIVLDAGNLVTPATLRRQREILTEAVDLLASHIICFHAKDLDGAGPAPLGEGCLDYDLIIARAQRLEPLVPIIIQDVAEADAARSRNFLHAKLDVVSRD
jgi:sugar phosphate isomerase/epimerase